MAQWGGFTLSTYLAWWGDEWGMSVRLMDEIGCWGHLRHVLVLRVERGA